MAVRKSQRNICKLRISSFGVILALAFGSVYRKKYFLSYDQRILIKFLSTIPEIYLNREKQLLVFRNLKLGKKKVIVLIKRIKYNQHFLVNVFCRHLNKDEELCMTYL